MDPAAALTTRVLALGTIAAQLASVLLILALIARRESLTRLTPYLLPATLVLTLAASLLTLVYSEIFGFAACFYCWVQRAFLYPMPVILGLALWKRWQHVWKVIVALSSPGALVALYQHYLQIGGTSLVPCPAVPGAADCARRIIFEFGYITFPLMSFSIFVLSALLMIAFGVSRKSQGVIDT